ARQLDDLLKNHLVDAEEARVARSPVVDHGLLDAGRGGERAGRQQQRITGFRSGRLARGHAADGSSPRLSVQYIIHMLPIDFTYMTPTQLRAFHLVAESGSFSAAARA